MLNGGVDMAVRLGHLLEAGVVDHEVGAQHVEQSEQVVAAQLDRGRGQQDDGLGVVAEVSHALMQEGLAVSDVMRFIDDHEIEFRRRVEVEQPLILLLPRPPATEDEVGIEQREGQNGLRVLLGPFAFKVRFLQAMPQQAIRRAR